MFRRPPRRSPFGPPRSRPPAAPGTPALRMLRQANRLMENGQYAQAFPLLKRLADGAVRRDMPVRAANLYLLAGRARLKMGGPEDAITLARQGIQLLIAAGQVERLQGLLPRVIEELEQYGRHDLAIRLRAEMSALLGGSGTQAVPAARGRLPGRCPACGAPARADEVTWINEHSAECAYCGTSIEAE